METTKLSSKGQVIIPKAVRENHHWQPGTEFIIEETASGIYLRPSRLFPPTRLKEGVGCAGYKGVAKSLDEIESGLTADLRKQWSKGGTR